MNLPTAPIAVIPIPIIKVSHDLPPTHWHCNNCRKTISMSERNAVFDATLKVAKEKCDLKTLEYNKEIEVGLYYQVNLLEILVFQQRGNQ